MSWITITESDVKSRLAGAEFSAFSQAAKSDDQGELLPGIIARVVDEVRGYVGACKQNRLGEGATIPQKLLDAALAMIRYRLITRLPIAVSEERTREYADAISLMRDVAACKFAIEEPTEISGENTGGVKPLFGDMKRNFSREAQDGI